jgi:hypothetical protein
MPTLFPQVKHDLWSHPESTDSGWGLWRFKMAKLRQQWTYSLRPGLTLLPIVIPVGAVGAVGSYEVGHGLKSVTRTSAGLLRINLDEKYLGLSGFTFSPMDLTTADGYTASVVDSRAVTGPLASINGGDGYLDVQISNDASAAADVVNAKVAITLMLKTSEQG